MLKRFVGAVLLFPALLWGRHPADTDADGVLTIAEVAAYAGAWRRGEAWPAGPSPIPRAYVEQAEIIWRAGERYRRQEHAPLPYAWVPDPPETSFVALETQRAQPLDAIRLYGLPAGDVRRAHFTVEGEYGEFEAFIGRNGKNDPVLIAPINPYDIGGSGRLLLEIVDADGVTRFAGPLLLEPLPSAPGSARILFERMRALLDAIASELDADLDGYRETGPETLPPLIGPLVVLDALLSQRDVQGSLGNRIDVATDSFPGEETWIDPADRILAKLGLADLLSQRDTAGIADIGSRRAPAAIGPAAKRPVNNTAHLSQQMRIQRRAEQASEGLMRELFDAAETGLGAAGTIDKLLTLGGGGRSIPGAGGLDVIQKTYAVWKFLQKYDAGTLPSRFDEMRFVVSGPPAGPLMEDACADQDQVRVGPEVKVVSTGFSYKEALDFKIDPFVRFAAGPWNWGVDLANWFREAVAHWAIDLLDIEVPPHEWAWFRVAWEDYADFEEPAGVLTAAGYDAAAAAMKFKPEKAGSASVTARVRPDAFGDRTIAGSVDLEVLPVVIKIVEAPRAVLPGANAVFYADVEQGRDRSEFAVDWSASDGTITSISKEGNRWRMTWRAPPNRTDFPVWITAFSAGDACGRGRSDADPREDTVTVVPVGFEITPRLTCMRSDETGFFRVDAASDELPDAITWGIVAGGGELTPIDDHEAAYTAVNTDGPVTIRAENAADPANFAEITFRIDCATTVTWSFEPDFLPPAQGVFQTASASFVTSVEDFAIAADLLVNIEEVIPSDGSGPGSVAGSMHGAGIFTSADLSAEAALFDDSWNHRAYVVTPLHQTYEYTLSASIAGIILDDEDSGRIIELVEESEGSFFRVAYEGGGDFNAQIPPNAEIVDYQWLTSAGTAAAGANAVFEFPRSVGTFWIRLTVTDNYGNTAVQQRHVRTVMIDGAFTFKYDPDGEPAGCFDTPMPFPGAPPPEACSVDYLLQGAADGSFSSGSMGVFSGLRDDTPSGPRFIVVFSD